MKIQTLNKYVLVNKLFNYAGSKGYLTTIVSEIIRHFSMENCQYVEPFFGSGALFYNLDFIPKQSIINDFNSDIMSIHKMCKENNSKFYEKCLKWYELEYPNVINNGEYSKNVYLNIVKKYNENQFDEWIKPFCLMIILNCTMNSLPSFTKQGTITPRYGERINNITSKQYQSCHNRLKNSQILSTSYEKVVENIKNSIIFLDPPYAARPLAYNNGFLQIDFLDVLSKIDDSNLILYTDIKTEKNMEFMEKYHWSKIILRDVKNICPTKNTGKSSGEEILLINRDYEPNMIKTINIFNTI